jgi:hypothetical protein
VNAVNGSGSTSNCVTGGSGTPQCFPATDAGTYRWRVSYFDGFNTVTGACGHESFVITNDNPCGAPSKPLVSGQKVSVARVAIGSSSRVAKQRPSR